MKSRIARLGITGTAALAAVLALGATGAVAASAEQGRVAFARHGCWQCHGYQGQGGVTGPKLAPDPIPFETFANFVRTTGRNMPPFREPILSDDDLADIYAYLQSVARGPDPASILLLNE